MAGEPRGHSLRPAIDLVVGDAEDGVAGGSQTLVSFVVLVLGAGAGVAGAVDFDDQVQLRPVEVDLEVLHFGVDEWFGQAGFACESEEAVFSSLRVPARPARSSKSLLVDHVRELVR